MFWPTVGVYIPTFNRAGIVTRTIELLRSNLRYSGNVEIVVGCDGTDNTSDCLRGSDCIVLHQPSGSLGANVNRMVSAYRNKGVNFLIGMDDDHHLVSPLNLDRHINKMMDDTTVGRIHLLMEAKGDEHFDSYKFRGYLDNDHYWVIDWNCPERFLMSFRPHLVSDLWWQVMGLLPVGYKTGETEWIYSGHTKQVGMNSGGVKVLVPLRAYDAETWHHVGDSWNRRGL